ncbi:C2H2 zinc finger protein [Verticillium dahliae]|nr:C2H2 zinc finger protein [Verticillium dahliae]
MGNSNTKESRPEPSGASGRLSQAPSREPTAASRPNEQSVPSSDRSRNRQSRFTRGELNLLGLGSTGANNREEAPYERRETKQEREARRLEKERTAREKERERSMKEEHVDGGYLVTLGVYTGPEDFNKQVVRQLQLDRKIAPFWRGLDDKDDSWTEYQLVCAGRAPTPDSANTSSQNLANLTVPMGPRSLSVESDYSTSTANAGSALASPTTNPKRSSSPFKPRAKALAAALSGSSRNNSSANIAPREITLPHDPFVNGQLLEVFLYKDASECPICFMYYPPYLNRTRCCDQPICSECFVQIKRPEPHYPEHHGEPGEPGQPQAPNPEQNPEMLISEPAACPYCQQSEFGVTYEAPPFRRGLAHAMPPLSSHNTAMSSQSSLSSTMPGSPPTGRRRTQSLSANAPNVIATDRVRPDWSSKLAAQRAHQARRAAAATALHTAAFLIGENQPQRGFAFTRPGRFSRRNTGQNSSSANPGDESPLAHDGEDPNGMEPGPRGSSGRGILGRRSRMDELEDMMFMEAVRLSLAAEEDRKRKQEKAERKDAKKREKEERKAAKKAEKQGHFYNGGSSASASSLSLGFGRRRGNSTTSNLRMEATQNAQTSSTKVNEVPGGSPTSPTPPLETGNKGKGIDRGQAESEGVDSTATQSSSTVPSLPIPTTSRGPSHLRQMSNASSISSSLADSAAGSYSNTGCLDGNNPRGNGTSSGARGEEADRDATEPMYNFRSLAEMVGVDIENGESLARAGDTNNGSGTKKRDDDDAPEAEQVEDVRPPVEDSVATLKPPPTIIELPEEHGETSVTSTPISDISTPEVMITPETPAPLDDEEGESKKLGYSMVERSPAITH